MSAPLCDRKWCRRQVKPCKPGERPYRHRPLRYVDGIRYRWFCSKACVGKVNGALPVPQAAVVRASKAMAAKCAARRLQRLVALVKAEMDTEGRVAPVAFTKALLRLERQAYQRGWEAAQRDARRAA